MEEFTGSMDPALHGSQAVVGVLCHRSSFHEVRHNSLDGAEPNLTNCEARSSGTEWPVAKPDRRSKAKQDEKR